MTKRSHFSEIINSNYRNSEDGNTKVNTEEAKGQNINQRMNSILNVNKEEYRSTRLDPKSLFTSFLNKKNQEDKKPKDHQSEYFQISTPTAHRKYFVLIT